MRLRGWAVAVVALVLATGAFATQRGHAPGAATPADQLSWVSTVPVPAGAQLAVVRRHVDGDTLVLVGGGAARASLTRDPPLLLGRPTKVRLLEVDTPEVSGGLDCYGRQASAFTDGLLPIGATVRVVADRDRVDRYGRTLLYLWTRSGVFVQEVLARQGYARAELVAPNDRYIDVVRGAARAAQAEHRGVWSCDPLPARFRRAAYAAPGAAPNSWVGAVSRVSTAPAP